MGWQPSSIWLQSLPCLCLQMAGVHGSVTQEHEINNSGQRTFQTQVLWPSDGFN